MIVILIIIYYCDNTDLVQNRFHQGFASSPEPQSISVKKEL